MLRLLSIPVICLALTACSSTGTAPQSASTKESPPAPSAIQAAPASPVIAMETDSQRQASLAMALSKQSIYFDYDNFILKPQYQTIVKQNADFMRQFGKDVLVLEGNADDRGSKEYNLALGQKRAESVRKALLSIGVTDARIEAVSYGEERPHASCTEEKCWQENRRVDFVHKTK